MVTIYTFQTIGDRESYNIAAGKYAGIANSYSEFQCVFSGADRSDGFTFMGYFDEANRSLDMEQALRAVCSDAELNDYLFQREQMLFVR